MKFIYPAVFRKTEKGTYKGYFPDLAECYGEGDTLDEAIEEANEVIESTEKNEVRDAALIAAAQKVEHYEIASYGTLATLAEQLGYKKAVKLLAETLEEEKETDLKLTDLAVGNINQKAQK